MTNKFNIDELMSAYRKYKKCWFWQRKKKKINLIAFTDAYRKASQFLEHSSFEGGESQLRFVLYTIEQDMKWNE